MIHIEFLGCSSFFEFFVRKLYILMVLLILTALWRHLVVGTKSKPTLRFQYRRLARKVHSRVIGHSFSLTTVHFRTESFGRHVKALCPFIFGRLSYPLLTVHFFSWPWQFLVIVYNLDSQKIKKKIDGCDADPIYKKV